MSRAGSEGRHTVTGRRRRALWIVAAFLAVDAVVAVLAVTVLPRVGPWSEPTAAAPSSGAGPPALAGYPVLRGNSGFPIEAGRPWGSPCAPLTLVAGAGLPDPWRQRLSEVLAEAAAGGVPVLAAGTAPDGRPVSTVAVDAASGPAPTLSDGRPQQLLWAVSTALATGGGREHIRALSTAVFLASTGEDAALHRRVLRTLLARAFGLDGSTRPDSGLAEDLTATVDAFTASDLAALRTMSGCA